MIFVFAVSTSFSQNIEGVWQLNTPLKADYESRYEFDEDGAFIYYPAFYNTLQIIYSLNGHYVINADSIYLTIDEIVVNDVNLENLNVDKSKYKIPEGEWFWVKDGFDNIEGMHRDFPSASNFWSISYHQRRAIQIPPKTFASSFEFFEDDERVLIIDGHKLNYKYIGIDENFYYYIYGASDIDD